MKAWLAEAKGERGGWTDLDESILPDHPVEVAVTHSAINYKDALAVTGRSPIFRSFPMIAGIDLVGTVIADATGRFAPGTGIVATGWGLGETTMGAYAQKARIAAEWAVPLAEGLDARSAAAIGTGGLTAALSVLALEDAGLVPQAGPVLVTGATGGVGGHAVLLLARLGYHVVAATGRLEQADYLRDLGAADILDRAELEGEPRPLGKQNWAAAVDVTGGNILANTLAGIEYGGAVAASGLAGSMSLPVTVAPFILRGVSLLGIDSVSAPAAKRERAWALLRDHVDAARMAAMTHVAAFEAVDDLAPQLLDQKLRGRTVLEWR